MNISNQICLSEPAKKYRFIYHLNTTISMDIQQLVQKAKAIGHDEVPVGGGDNSEAASALEQIFKANPGKFFRSKDLGKLLNEGGIVVTKIGNVLFAMKNTKRCSQVRKGVYTSYSSKYDANISVSPPKED